MSRGNFKSKEYKYYFTYQTKNLINGKTYIGARSTNKIDDGYFGSGVLLKKAIKKYGKENFERQILCFFETREEMWKEEEFLITEDWIKDNSNYNIKGGGLGGLRSQEAIEKFIEMRRNMPPPSLEVKLKISKALKGSKRTPEAIRNSAVGNIGRKHSTVTRKLMSEKAKGRVFSETHKKNLSKAAKERRIKYANKYKDASKKRSKAIIQFDMLGNFIAEYSSIREMERQTGYQRFYVSQCCNGTKCKYNGFVWKYKEERIGA